MQLPYSLSRNLPRVFECPLAPRERRGRSVSPMESFDELRSRRIDRRIFEWMPRFHPGHSSDGTTLQPRSGASAQRASARTAKLEREGRGRARIAWHISLLCSSCENALFRAAKTDRDSTGCRLGEVSIIDCKMALVVC